MVQLLLALVFQLEILAHHNGAVLVLQGKIVVLIVVVQIVDQFVQLMNFVITNIFVN